MTAKVPGTITPGVHASRIESSRACPRPRQRVETRRAGRVGGRLF